MGSVKFNPQDVEGDDRKKYIGGLWRSRKKRLRLLPL